MSQNSQNSKIKSIQAKLLINTPIFIQKYVFVLSLGWGVVITYTLSYSVLQ